jgi:hypothetical protein
LPPGLNTNPPSTVAATQPSAATTSAPSSSWTW